MMMPASLELTGAHLVAVTTIPNVSLRDDPTPSKLGIRMTVSGPRDQGGQLKPDVYPVEATEFLARDEVLLRTRNVYCRVVTTVLPLARAVTLCVDVSRPGRYAVLVIHKRSSNRTYEIDSDVVSVLGAEQINQYRDGLAGLKQMSQ